MYSTLISVALFSTFAITATRAADFVIDTPQLTQCQPAHITWQNGKGPFNLIVVPSSDPCNKVLADLGDHSGTSMTWNNVTLPSGSQVELSLEDADGDEAWSGTITIAGSSDASCLPANSSIVSSAAALASSPVASINPTTLVATGALANPTTATGASSTGGAAVPVGAANAGLLPSSASGLRQYSVPAMAISAFAAVFALAM